MKTTSVPFFRPDLEEQEIAEVVDTLRSGWLTTGPRTGRFEKAFAEAVGARHAVAVNSCTAGMHLATVALGLSPGQAVLVPTMTFAATAEVVLYAGAVPILVDCDPHTLSLDLGAVPEALAALRRGDLPADPDLPVVGLMPVHVAGLMLDSGRLGQLAEEHGWWQIEDAAHAFPSAWRPADDAPWQRCGEATAKITCFSFYANKTLTTGEGGMAVTDDEALAAEIRSLSLHGLSKDAWKRYAAAADRGSSSRKASWDYRIVAPGYKYNLTDIAAALGLRQLERAEAMRLSRLRIAQRFSEAFARLEEIELPPDPPNRVHSWHLYQIKLRPGRLQIDRNAFLEGLRERGVGFSVHWRPLHLHPLYERLGWRPEHAPVATEVWERAVSLPIFPSMREDEIDAV
ncbi:MAG: DegT/DnrJ/EryC1/StrS aminotransferase family protein, partial [Acidobacteriota bacterium]